MPDSYSTRRIDPAAEGSRIIDGWMEVIDRALAVCNGHVLKGIGVAMPGPFDYAGGISLIEGVDKYEKLFGVNVRQALADRLAGAGTGGVGRGDVWIGGVRRGDGCVPISFENDAACFGLGECLAGEGAAYHKVVAITLGTGFGAAFVDNRQLMKSGPGVPAGGYLYHVPFRDGIAEDYFSSRWLVAAYEMRAGVAAKDVRQIAERAFAGSDAVAVEVFRELGRELGVFLAGWLKNYHADALVIGGSIAQSSALFLPEMREALKGAAIEVFVGISQQPELAAVAGAAHLVGAMTGDDGRGSGGGVRRKTGQPLLPKRVEAKSDGYDIYPYELLGSGHIFSGYAGLALWISQQKTVLIDGYIGIDWEELRERIARELNLLGVRVLWYETSAFLKPAGMIEEMVAPFLGTPGTVWGKRTTLTLGDFFRPELAGLGVEAGGQTGLGLAADDGIKILFGIGAGLCGWNAPILYVELPKNEIQYRMRAGSAGNLGRARGNEADVRRPGHTVPACEKGGAPLREETPAEMYKRYYFVDWVVLNRHRQQIKSRIAAVADGQWCDDIHWMQASSVQKGLENMSHNLIRARPWFEPGVWGGQWMKSHIPALNQQETNYAWSFELIAVENGLLLESDGYLQEISWDWLMEYDAAAVLGKDAERFGLEFPIRFDFLDTYNGGNLSIQCHPSPDYIQQQFGETITQDETYYILDCTPDAGVYLGFHDNIDPAVFRADLEHSQSAGEAIDIQQYVQRLPSEKHGLYLIPNCTVHGAGKNNLVLEISATPYIFTFKMYDWMRLDLNDAPRPINIEHAFHNLDFSRRGPRVKEELVSKPVVLEGGDEGAGGWAEGVQIELLPTHEQHFYAIHRISFLRRAVIRTEGQCHLLMLVEGTSITVKTKRGSQYHVHYAETFVLPAAAEEYELINHHEEPVKLIKAFIKTP
jgi:predicted NBD/HSP70 family sugar kinase/mannose-6-phosphate isomerase class I